MPGLYSHTTRATGTVLTASIYNGDHQNHIDNHIPSMMDDFSADVTEMQAITDPGGVGSEDLATTLAEELRRLRFAIKRITGGAQWYSAPATNLGVLSAIGTPVGDADVDVSNILTLAGDGGYYVYSGTDQIDGIATLGAGTTLWIAFTAVAQLTHHATDFVLLPSGGTNITTAAGDRALFFEYAAGDWVMLHYQRADGTLPNLLYALLAERQAWTGVQRMGQEAVAYAASITPDLSEAPWKQFAALTGALTLNLPINCAVGDHFIMYIPQDSTGGRVVTANAGYLTDITWSTGANEVDLVSCTVIAVSGTTATKVVLIPLHQGTV